MAKRRPARVPSIRTAPAPKPRRAEPRPPAPQVDDVGPGESGSRFAPVRRRAAQAKFVISAAALVSFGVGMALARASYAGHSKRPLRPLAAPAGFVHVVRQNLLQAGIVAPAQAPPGASTSVS
jgi:hypothetical protein